MEISGNTFSLKWLDYQLHEDAIISLRKKIFVDELKRHEDFLYNDHDKEGLHLAIYDGSTMIGVSSSYIITAEDPMMNEISLKPVSQGRVCIQTAKRGALKEYRGHHLNELKEIVTGAQILELFDPEYFFATLYDENLETKVKYYEKMFGFKIYKEVNHKGTKITIVISEKGPAYDFVSGNYQTMVIPKAAELGIIVPSLIEHIKSMPQMKNLLSRITLSQKYRSALFND